MPFDVRDLAARLGGELEASDAGLDSRVRRLAEPGPDCGDAVVVLFDPAEAAKLQGVDAALIVGPPGLGVVGSTAVIRVEDPRLALAKLTALFDDRPLPPAGVHPEAVVAPDAVVGEGTRIGARAVVGPGVRLGRAAIIGEGVLIGAGAIVGDGSRLHPGVVLADGVVLGERVIVHSGAVVGSDGFGYVPSPTGAAKLHHLGSVVVGNDVEIGANTCVDRGTLNDTRIGDRTKIDNLCQIAHNVVIGSDCLIAGCSGIAGSTRVGDRVTLAGRVSVADHLEIGQGATLGFCSSVTKSVPAGETWLGYPAVPHRRFARQSYLLGRLERVWSFVKQYEGTDRR